jgi:TnpA family transposase
MMPRLKRIKYEGLYLPDKVMASDFPNLAGVLTRPIRWKIMEQQYDEMMKATVAMRYGYATAEAILRRYSSVNSTHPTYKALIELGKAEKTIFLCNYLSSIDMRREIQAGLNVIENWNGTNDFIFYARRGRLMTNDQQDMEISMLSLHLLQNCLILINTLLLERTIEQRNMLEEMSPEDMRALTPLFYGHVNPYGLFELDLERASFLEVA